MLKFRVFALKTGDMKMAGEIEQLLKDGWRFSDRYPTGDGIFIVMVDEKGAKLIPGGQELVDAAEKSKGFRR